MTTMPEDHHWLDKHIAEQAAYYGATPEKFGKFMHDMAEAQELMEEDNALPSDLPPDMP